MSSCTACGKALRSGARFCASCGQPVTAPPLVEQANAQAGAAEQAMRSSAPEPAVTASLPSVEQGARPHVAPELVSSGGQAPVHGPQAAQVPPTSPESRYPAPGAATGRQYGAAAISAAAVQARVHFEASVQRVPLPPELITRAIRDGALVAAGTWAVFAVLAGLVDVFSEGNAAPMMWLRAGALALAATVGSGVTVSGDVGDIVRNALRSWSSATETPRVNIDAAASVSVQFMPLGLTAILLVVVFLVARKAGRSSPAGEWRSWTLQALIMAAAFAVTATVICAALRFHEGASTVGASPVAVFFGALGWVFVSAFLALNATGSHRAWIPRTWVSDARTGAEIVIGFVALAMLVVAIRFVYEVATSAGGSSAPRTSAEFGFFQGISVAAVLVVCLVAYLPTLFVLAGGIVMGAAVAVGLVGTGLAESMAGAQQHQFGILEGGVSGWILLAVLAGGLLIVAVVGIRATLRSPAEQPQLRLWQPAVITAGLWVTLAWLSAISVRVDGSVSSRSQDLASLLGGSSGNAGVVVTAGLSLAGVALAGAVWTLIAVAAGGKLTLGLGGAAPGALAVLGGRGMHESWQVMVADSMMRRGQQPPKRLSAVAQGLRAGAIAPPTTPVI